MEKIRKITTEELRGMNDREGLVFQGCGGDPREWLDGINELLTKENILLDGSRFESCCVFEHDGMTNILFPFGDVKLNMGRLAIWRLETHLVFGGTWLSDYLDINFERQEEMDEGSDRDETDEGISLT